jgi:hypothetical protein
LAGPFCISGYLPVGGDARADGKDASGGDIWGKKKRMRQIGAVAFRAFLAQSARLREGTRRV